MVAGSLQHLLFFVVCWRHVDISHIGDIDVKRTRLRFYVLCAFVAFVNGWSRRTATFLAWLADNWYNPCNSYQHKINVQQSMEGQDGGTGAAILSLREYI